MTYQTDEQRRAAIRADLQHIISKTGGWTERPAHTYQSPTAVQSALAAGVSFERRQPARPASLASDVIVPLAQALATGIIAFILNKLTLNWNSGTVAAGVIALAWLVLLIDHRSALWNIERVIGADLNRDGFTGPPEPPPTTRVEIIEPKPRSHHEIYLQFDLDPGVLSQFARAAIGGQSLSEASWCGTGNPLSRAQYNHLRDTLITRGLARWRNPAHPRLGWEPTAKGCAVLRELAQRT